MPLGSIGLRMVCNGSQNSCNPSTGLILLYLEILSLFVGVHILLGLRIFYYTCGFLITRADTDDIMLCKNVALLF